MEQKKILLGGAAVLLLVAYNGAQPGLRAMRTMSPVVPEGQLSKDELTKVKTVVRRQRYGPSLEWLDRLTNASATGIDGTKFGAPKLDFRMLSSLMLAGLASGFKSQVANLLWMKSDEYWHKGMLTRQNPIMEAVVTLDPQFLEAWDTAGWHWAYNIFADLPLQPGLTVDKKMPPEEKASRLKALREKQDVAINTGLDYYARGTQMNPEKYLLWFKFGWTRLEKAGLNDEETINLYRTARLQSDARNQEMTMPGPDGKPKSSTVQGLDLMGRTIGHAYERMPNIAKALEVYGDDLLRLKNQPQQKALLNDAGRYWAKYSSLYSDIADVYNSGDAVTKAKVKELVPDVEHLIAAHTARMEAGAIDKGAGSQPTGAFVSIAARYKPAWDLWQAGKLDEAAQLLIGVMNCDTKYHLQGLPVMEKIWALRGDAPEAIKGQVAKQIEYERESSQEIGLHILAKIFEAKMNAETDPVRQKAWARMAYEQWCRARERDSLNFQARRRSVFYEDKYGFTIPDEILKQVADSRKKGAVVAAPPTVPKIEDYLKKVSQTPV